MSTNPILREPRFGTVPMDRVPDARLSDVRERLGNQCWTFEGDMDLRESRAS